MYFLLKIRIFHCYVSLPEGTPYYSILFNWMLGSPVALSNCSVCSQAFNLQVGNIERGVWEGMDCVQALGWVSSFFWKQPKKLLELRGLIFHKPENKQNPKKKCLLYIYI